jgi:hypothetical protein
MESSNFTARRESLIQDVYLRENAVPVLRSNNRLERSRGKSFVEPRSGVDDLDKSVSFIVGATPRRST